MPGIVGIITKRPRAWAEPVLQRMVESMQHESFYKTGTWIHEDSGVYAGWTALEGSFSAEMPVRDEQGNMTLIFAGEDFQRSIKQGAASSFSREYVGDSQFPRSLNGRFQGLLVDLKAKTATLFVDRFGLHKVYYYESADAFYFAAEAKAILHVCPEARRIDPRTLAEMVVCGCVRDQRTMFKDLATMPAGGRWIFQNGSLARKERFFDQREWEELEPLSGEAYYEQLRDAFVQAVPRFFEACAPVGMSLTGGLDTRMIMAWHRQPPGSLPCYTFGGMYRECQDVAVARRVAEICKQPHQVIPVANDFLSQFARYAERTIFLTDGNTHVGCAPDLYVQESVRKIAPIRVSGTYGSEVLRGPAVFKPVNLLSDLFEPEFLDHMTAVRQAYGSRNGQHPVSYVVFQHTPMRGVETLEQTQVSVRSPFLDNETIRTAFRAPKPNTEKGDIFANNEVCNRIIAEGSKELARLQTDRGLGGVPGIASAVTKQYLEFSFKAEYAYDYGMPQWLARVDHFFSPLHLERLFLGRHKFNHFRVWYRNELSGYVKDVLLDPRTLSRPYLRREAVEAVVNGHVKGDRNYTLEIHRLLTMEWIHRLFADAA